MSAEAAEAPLIVTLEFDRPSFEHFQAMRVRHFPAHRNHIPAHLTLFHHLPGEEIGRVSTDLDEVASAVTGPALSVTGLRFLGYGSAYEIASSALARLRADLALRWSAWLSPQDRQSFRPHVTIQNKAPAAAAKALFAELDAEFRPFEARGTALLLWHYRGGPWEAAGRFAFRS